MKVAIVGGGKRTRDLAPYDDEDWEVWGLGNQIDKYPKKLDRIFEIHTKHQLDTLQKKGYAEYLAGMKIKLIVGNEFPIKDKHIHKFPLDEALSLMGGHLTSSLSYMISSAIMENASHIYFYGVEMNVDDNEYFYQRPALYAWKGYAESKGIEVKAPNSSLFNDPLYPLWAKANEEGPYTKEQFQIMAGKHQAKIDEVYQEINRLNQIVATHSGCKQVYERLAKIARATDDGVKVYSIEESTDIKEDL